MSRKLAPSPTGSSCLLVAPSIGPTDPAPPGKQQRNRPPRQPRSNGQTDEPRER